MKYRQLFITFNESASIGDINFVERELSGLVGHGRLQRYEGRYSDFEIPRRTYEFGYFSGDTDDPYLFARIIGGNPRIKDISELDELFDTQLGKKRI